MSDTTTPLSPIDFQLSEMSWMCDSNQIIHHRVEKCHFRGDVLWLTLQLLNLHCNLAVHIHSPTF